MLREGAQKLLAEAVQAELERLLEEYAGQHDGQGRKRLVRNGYLPMREIQTGIGGIPVRIPRVRARGTGEESEKIIRFRSSLVPPYLRRSKSVEELLPSSFLIQVGATLANGPVFRVHLWLCVSPFHDYLFPCGTSTDLSPQGSNVSSMVLQEENMRLVAAISRFLGSAVHF